MIPLRDVGPFGRILMSDAQRKLLLKCIELQEVGPNSTSCGICSNVGAVWKQGEYLKLAFKAWPLFSGDIDYPVPDPAGGSAEDSYDRNYNQWVGEYGELRKQLLQHCIEFLSVPRNVYA